MRFQFIHIYKLDSSGLSDPYTTQYKKNVLVTSGE